MTIANSIVPKWPMSQPIMRRNISWPMVEHQQINSGFVQSQTISNVEFIFTLKLLLIFCITGFDLFRSPKNLSKYRVDNAKCKIFDELKGKSVVCSQKSYT